MPAALFLSPPSPSFPKLDHPSIVKFHDSFMEKDFFCIITEFCEVCVCACVRAYVCACVRACVRGMCVAWHALTSGAMHLKAFLPAPVLLCSMHTT